MIRFVTETISDASASALLRLMLDHANQPGVGACRWCHVPFCATYRTTRVDLILAGRLEQPRLVCTAGHGCGCDR